MYNNTVRITKEFSFEMSHLLYNHKGDCKNIHGHSYRLFVTIKGRPNGNVNAPSYGMLIDFAELKEIINSKIILQFDHALAVSEEAYKNSFLTNYRGKIVVKPFEPTCENLVSCFAEIIRKNLPKNVELHSLKLYETPTSYTEWHLDDQSEFVNFQKNFFGLMQG